MEEPKKILLEIEAMDVLTWAWIEEQNKYFENAMKKDYTECEYREGYDGPFYNIYNDDIIDKSGADLF